MYFKDLSDEIKSEIIQKYQTKNVTKKDLQKEYGYGQKICDKIFKDVPNKRSFEFDNKSNKNILWNKLFEEQYKSDLHYWMGFCMADGSVDKTMTKTSYTLTLSLCLADMDIDRVLAFAYFWTGNNDVHLIKIPGHNTKYGCKQSTSSFKLSITKYEINFKNFGLIKNKTYNFQEPVIINKENMINFLRGWFDGDGCVSLLKNQECVHVTGMSEQIDWYTKSIILIGYNGTFTIETPNKVSEAIRVRFNNKKNMKMFYDLLKPNKNEEYMSRKWDKLKIFFK